MKRHITLICNQNHSRKATALIDDDSDLLKIAKNKLKMPRACLLFGLGGEQSLSNLSVPPPSIIFVSCGEPYQGPPSKLSANVSIIGENSDIDSCARDELAHVASLPGVIKAFGMPDLHAGPTGCAILSKDCIYPHLAESDIGCGIALFKAGKVSCFNLKSMVKFINQIPSLDINTIRTILDRHCLPVCAEDECLGSLGFSNHFAEFMMIDIVMRQEPLEHLNLSTDDMVLCVHSGSRGLGKKIFDQFGSGCLQAENIYPYVVKRDHAVKWARLNRNTIASRLLDEESPSTILDVSHNSISTLYPSTPLEVTPKIWIHRKGAAPADHGPLVIPGSRGSYSYLVQPKDMDMSDNGFSLAHGAGRQLTRSKAHAKAIKRYGEQVDHLKVTKLGSHVLCTDSTILAEEIPEAYKNIEAIIDDLSPYIDVITKLRPVLTIKDF